MTDRELLEKAAKAINFGDGKFCWTESEYPRGSGKYGALWNYVGHMDTAELWNPLLDDGDALRLAVKLRLVVDPYCGAGKDDTPGSGVWLTSSYLDDAPDFWEAHNGTPTQATNLAIVRAAAAIREQMP